ncbi:MAG: hypothetical protein CMJ83_02605 [Planctomycetes bacterium]|jgi:hypothetical protein|nr:hypothetical protein [Planctomycetota bacterium]
MGSRATERRAAIPEPAPLSPPPPPSLAETPEWFQEQFDEQEVRRAEQRRDSAGRDWCRRRFGLLSGAISAWALGMVFVTGGVPAHLLMLGAGGGAGYLVARCEMSAIGGILVFGGGTCAVHLIAMALGLLVASSLAVPVTWLSLACAGAFIAGSIESERLNHLPF